MTDPATALTLERALTVGGIGRAESGELSPVTRQIYATQVGKARAWKAAELHSASRTFTPEQVAQYALWLVEQGYARATAELAVRAIRWSHRVAGEPVPDGLPATYVLRGRDSTADDHDGVNALDTPARRDPSDLLTAFTSACKPNEPKGRRDLLIVNLLYSTGITTQRLSELDVRDVAALALGPDVEARLDLGGRRYVVLRHRPDVAHYPTLCAVCCAARWLEELDTPAAAQPGAPLLRAIDKGGNIAGGDRYGGRYGGRFGAAGRLHAKNINNVVLRNLAARAGLLDVLVSPARALRIAGACAAYVAGGVNAADAAARAGYTPGSANFMRHLLELTAPTGEEVPA